MKPLILMLSLLPLTAGASEEIAKRTGCTACHATAKKLLGPSFQQIAAKYKDKGQAEASAYLAERIRKGSSGVWGAVPMPAQPTLKDEDLKAVSSWIVGLTPP